MMWVMWAAMIVAIVVIESRTGYIVGWYAMADEYPDRSEEPVFTPKKFRPFAIGGEWRLSGTLTISACPSGLRVGWRRLLEPRLPNIFVPWSDISVTRYKPFLLSGPMATFLFRTGSLAIPANIADQLLLSTPGAQDVADAMQAAQGGR
jgi:hypothetical protein